MDRSHQNHQLVLPQPWGAERPQRLIEEACDVLFHLVGGQLAWISDSIEALLGWRPEELHNRSLDLLTDPSEPAALQALVAAATGQQVEADTRLKHRDGHWRWAHITLAPRGDPAAPPGAIGCMRDIHAQVVQLQGQEAAHRALAASEARYRLVAEHSADALFDADPSGVPTWFASSPTELTGWRPEELVGHPIEPLIHPDHRQRHRNAMAALLVETRQRLEVQLRCKDGHYTWIAISLRRLEANSGIPIAIVGGWRDIEAEIQARELLAQARRKTSRSEDLLHKVEEHTAIGLCLISAENGQIIKVNPALCRLLGRDETTLLNSSWAGLLHPQDRGADAGLRKDMEANQIHSYRLDQRLLKANGEAIWADLSISCIRNDDGSLRLIIAQLIDKPIDKSEQQESPARIQAEPCIFETILSHIDANVYIKDRSGHYLYLNRGVAASMGRPTKDILGKTDADLQPADVVAAVKAVEEEVFRTGMPIRQEEKIMKTSGEERVLLSAKMSLPRHGQPDCLLGYATDITALKQSEASLRESEQHFRLLAENASDVVLLLADDGRISWVSPTLNKALGWQPQDWMDHCYSQFLSHQGESLDFRENQKRLLRGEAIVAREQVLAKDGQLHWIEVHANPYHQGAARISGCVVSFWVIDEEVAATEALRCSEERHRLLADQAQDVIWTMELDGRISYVSPAVEQLRGFTPEEALSQSLEQIRTPEAVAVSLNYLQELQAAIAAGEQPNNFHTELEYYRKDGTTTWCEVLAVPLLDQRGHLRQLLGKSRNIQERKLHELELQKARDQAQIAKLAMLEANRALSAANIKLQELATTDPLTGISNRRTFEVKLKQEMERSHRYGHALTVVMFDIDHFKSINDSHGHHIGDGVLVEICRRISSQLRSTDHLARWGGEEFMVLMPHCDRETGKIVAEKLRALIVSQPIDPVQTVSASFGVAQLLEAEDRDHLLQRLDGALYQAKALGRNQVALACSALAGPPAPSKWSKT